MGGVRVQEDRGQHGLRGHGEPHPVQGQRGGGARGRVRDLRGPAVRALNGGRRLCGWETSCIMGRGNNSRRVIYENLGKGTLGFNSVVRVRCRTRNFMLSTPSLKEVKALREK